MLSKVKNHLKENKKVYITGAVCLVRCNETGEVFASQNRAADLLKIPKSLLTGHLNGKFESANGLTFERIGEAV